MVSAMYYSLNGREEIHSETATAEVEARLDVVLAMVWINAASGLSRHLQYPTRQQL